MIYLFSYQKVHRFLHEPKVKITAAKRTRFFKESIFCMCVRLANYLTKALLIYCVGITYKCEYKYFSPHGIPGLRLFKKLAKALQSS
jgi:hypothetical protein